MSVINRHLHKCVRTVTRVSVPPTVQQQCKFLIPVKPPLPSVSTIGRYQQKIRIDATITMCNENTCPALNCSASNPGEIALNPTGIALNTEPNVAQIVPVPPSAAKNRTNYNEDIQNWFQTIIYCTSFATGIIACTVVVRALVEFVLH